MTYIRNKKLQNYVHNVDTSFTSQAITETSKSDDTALDSTEVTYTPDSSALKVVYEIGFQTSWEPDDDKTILSFRLEYSDDSGSSWTDIAGTQCLIGSVEPHDGDKEWHVFSFRCILNVWSGERIIRANGPAWTNSTQYTLGNSYNPNGTTGAGSCPHVSIYSIY